VDRFWRPKGKEGPTYNLEPDWNRFTTQNTYNERGALLEVSDGDAHTWWEASAADYDEQGRLIEYQYGNGLTTTNHFNSLTGRMEGSGIIDGILGLAEYGFQYDRLGNLTQRSLSRSQSTLSETCTYDALNRLTRVDDASSFVAVVYDVLGNITSRSDVGSYLYNGPRPHAVSKAGDCDYFYDSNGNIIRRDRNNVYEFTANWNSFNKPTSIFSGTEGSEFQYSVDGRRTQQLIFEGTNVVKKVYATPAYEMKEILLNPAETNRANWQWEMDYVRIYVDTPAGKIGIYQQEGSTNGVGTVTRSYMHKNHLGSVVAVSDDSANITHYSFDAWGNRRDASDWSALSTFDHSSLATDRGFTGHEQLDHLDLVHMNGRIYDPVIGRMISPDPLIQAPENLQSFNRYSYVFNNPLTHTDPSGFKTKSKAAASEAATASTQLAENVSSTEISSQDNVGGSTTESSKQVDDYYSDGSGSTQVDSTNRATQNSTTPGDENIGSTANSADRNGYGDRSATDSQHTAEDNTIPTNPTLAAIAGDTATENPGFVNGAVTPSAQDNQGEETTDEDEIDWLWLSMEGTPSGDDIPIWMPTVPSGPEEDTSPPNPYEPYLPILGVPGDLALGLGVNAGPSIPGIPFSSVIKVGIQAFKTQKEQNQIEMPFGPLDAGGQIDRGNWIDSYSPY